MIFIPVTQRSNINKLFAFIFRDGLKISSPTLPFRYLCLSDLQAFAAV